MESDNDTLLFLNSAAVSQLHPAARDALAKAHALQSKLGLGFLKEIAPDLENARNRLAQFLDCAPSELAWQPNIATGLSALAHGITLEPHQSVITLDQEYPSSLYPWWYAASKAGARWIRIPSHDEALSVSSEKILSHVDADTRIVALSMVQYQTGATFPWKELTAEIRTRAPDAWIILDAAQSLGSIPFSFKELGCDALAGCFHKWMRGPLGLGFLAVRSDRISEIPPLIQGAFTYGSSEDRPPQTDALPAPHPNAHRFESGALPLSLIAGVSPLLETWLQKDLQEHYTQTLQAKRTLQSHFESRYPKATLLNPTRDPGAPESPILTYALNEADLERLRSQVEAGKLGVTLRFGRVRLSPEVDSMCVGNLE